MNENEQDRLYLDLKGARERLCRAQQAAPQWWSSDLQQALNIVDEAGTALCPQQWSRFDQPEYGNDEGCDPSGAARSMT